MGIPFKTEDIHKNDEGTYLIHYLAWDQYNGRSGTPADMKKLFQLAPDFNVDIQDAVGRTALHYACLYRKPAMVEVLLQHGADIELQDHEKRTAVFFAVQGSTAILKRMIDLGANLNHVDIYGYLPITAACGIGAVQNLQLLSQYDFDREKVDNDERSLVSRLVCSCGGRNISNLKLLVRIVAKTGVKFNHRDRDTGRNETGWIGFRMEVEYFKGHREDEMIDIMKTLIIAGSNPWEKDLEGKSTFHYLNDQHILRLKPTLKRFLKGKEYEVLLSIVTTNELKAFYANQKKLSMDVVYAGLEDGSPAKKHFEKTLTTTDV